MAGVRCDVGRRLRVPGVTGTSFPRSELAVASNRLRFIDPDRGHTPPRYSRPDQNLHIHRQWRYHRRDDRFLGFSNPRYPATS